MSKSYYRVFFSSNSQHESQARSIDKQCQRATIVFSFQAIHNHCDAQLDVAPNVKELLSCFLFKQFTTGMMLFNYLILMSKSYYRVFFSSNSQRRNEFYAVTGNVKELLSCFLFKQFTTHLYSASHHGWMSKSYYRVFFSSNSQRHWTYTCWCRNVKELLSCFLFKQFTTAWFSIT